MHTVGIIAEYNPFHEGHAYHIREIRKKYGSDTRIVAVMSGNYPQRGDVAIADKYTRASAAVNGGVDLVLELPFPYSGESAPVFAKAAVSILSRIGIVDTLSFGSECGDIEKLTEAARLLADESFCDRVRKESSRDDCGYPASYMKICRNTFGNTVSELLSSPNNMLAIEYLKASKKIGFYPQFHTVCRYGASHNAENGDQHYSAALIRKAAFEDSVENAVALLPENIRGIYENAASRGLFPSDIHRLTPVFLSYFAVNSPMSICNIADAGGGLYYRLFEASQRAVSLETLTSLASAKHYTASRVKRALRNTVIGVTSSDIRSAVEAVTLLAFNDVGRQMLRSAKKIGSLPILTKPADYCQLPERGKKQIELAMRADMLYTLCFPQIQPRDLFIRRSPYRMVSDTPDNFQGTSFVETIDKPLPLKVK